jgi:hypothetical protein
MNKVYQVEIDDRRLADQIDEIAIVQKIRPEVLIKLLLAKSLAPWSTIAQQLNNESA